MAELIRMSALGRGACVGDFYNYFTDLIIAREIEVPQECKSKERTSDIKFSFFYQMPDKFKSYLLKINSHLFDSIQKGFLDFEKLWFADYLNTNWPEDEASVAQVTVFIQVIRETESLDQQFLSSRIHECQVKSGGRATHLIEKVVYGTEMICSIRKPVDWQKETKESVERQLYLAAKDYFEQGFGRDSAPLPFELNDVTCNILNSAEAGRKRKGSFQDFTQYLKMIRYQESPTIWIPIEIVLRYIPDHFKIRLWFERNNDILFLTEQNQVMWDLITRESRHLLGHSSLDRFPPMQRVVGQFNLLLSPFGKKTEKCHEDARTEQSLDKIKTIFTIMSNMIDWLAQRRKEIEVFSLLLNGIQNLVALDLESIQTRARETEEKFDKVFVLKVEYKENTLVDEILEKIEDPASALELPILTITRLDKEGLAQVRRKLYDFAKEVDLKSGDPTRDTCYHIALVPSSRSYSLLYDGAVKVFDYSDDRLVYQKSLMPLSGPIDSQENQPRSLSLYPNLHSLSKEVFSTKQPQSTNAIACLESYYHSNEEGENPNGTDHETYPFLTDSDGMEVIESSRAVVASNTLAEFVGKREIIHPPTQEIDSIRITNTYKPSSIKITSNAGNEDTNRDLVCFLAASNETERNAQAAYSTDDRERSTDSSRREEEETGQYHETDASGNAFETNRKQERECEYDCNRIDNRLNEEPPLNPANIAEVFSSSSKYSRLIKEGQPNVYLLNAKETFVGEDYRRFEICHSEEASSPSFSLRNHKLIILTGATGCGKSTLINGMVNYILGVQWNDPFRFKCVRDNEATVKNQAHSQTSSVTAYIIHHREGMAVPYSLTIIDTPGYGDTRGVQRDKEITRNIHQFLTQQETSVDEIHAACFVAASGDSRLTNTQRYIIDSVLSIFGRDVKENIRLLVTFADNAHPPVVEACLAANFPVTTVSDGIIYSKFNSSVLYASNEQQDEDVCFDQLFWDMGQENFRKFFTMLEGMNGKDLKSTRNVIQSRVLLEQSLKDIEQELEVCFVKIENIEMFHRKMRGYGHKMESNKNFTFGQMEMRFIETPCKSGFLAYNCRHCRTTCERPIKQKNIDKLQNMKQKCDKGFCTCLAADHVYQQFEWRSMTPQQKTTQKDMNAEYQLNYDRKLSVEQQLADCEEELNVAKAKVFSLLEQVGISGRSLESTALRSNALTPSDYLSLMKSRVAEEQAPGYLTRLETLTELQNCLAAEASASASDMTAFGIPNQTLRSFRRSKSEGASRREDYAGPDRDRLKTFQVSQHSTMDDRMANSKSAGASDYSSVSNTITTSDSSFSQSNNQQALAIRGITGNNQSCSKPITGYSSESKHAWSSNVYQAPPKMGRLSSFFTSIKKF